MIYERICFMKKVISIIMALTVTLSYVVPANLAVVQATGGAPKAPSEQTEPAPQPEPNKPEQQEKPVETPEPTPKPEPAPQPEESEPEEEYEETIQPEEVEPAPVPEVYVPTEPEENEDKEKEKDRKKQKELANQVSLMFTGDMHSHMDSEEKVVNGKKTEVGGFARVKTVKDQLEEKYPGTYLVDAGGFSMGTAFQTIYRKEAPELVTMGEIGYDGAVLGNHEFDYDAEGVADMLNAAVKKEDDREKLPTLTGLNIDWKKTLKNDKTKSAGKKLKAAFDKYGVEDYTIVDKNGVKVAIFGLVGDDAIAEISGTKIYFSDYISRAKEIVEEIKRNEEADLIVCLSHSGIGKTKAEFDGSDDVKLAKEVKGIDLIVSGNNNIALDKPEKVGDTVLVSCGEYNQNAGHILFKKTSNGKFEMKKYQLIALDEDVKKDSDIQHMVDRYKSHIDDEYFSDYGYRYDEVLADNDIKFTPIENFGIEQKEDNLANLIGDSYIYTVNALENGKKNAQPVDVALVLANTVTDTLEQGKVTVSDVFNMAAFGMGDDGSIGSSMASIYLTGKELKHLAEVDASISVKANQARLYTSGLGYTINKYRMPLNKANNIGLVDQNGNLKNLDNDKLYRVVGNVDSCEQLKMVQDKTHGLLSIEPKDSKGNLIKNFDKAIIKDSDDNQLKEWFAIATYVDDFNDGEIPKYYATEHNRKVVDNSLNPVKLFKQPNHVAIMIYAIALIPIVIIVGIVLAIVKNRHKRRGYAKSIFSGSKNRNYNRVMSSRSRGVRPAKHKMNMSSRTKRGRKRRF